MFALLATPPIWYRKHFTMDPQYAYSKVEVVFDGANTGVQCL